MSVSEPSSTDKYRYQSERASNRSQQLRASTFPPLQQQPLSTSVTAMAAHPSNSRSTPKRLTPNNSRSSTNASFLAGSSKLHPQPQLHVNSRPKAAVDHRTHQAIATAKGQPPATRVAAAVTLRTDILQHRTSRNCSYDKRRD